MVSIVSDIINGITNVLQLICLVYVFSVHNFHQLHKDGIKVRVKHLDAFRPDLLGIDEQVLESADYQVADQLMFVTMLETLFNKGLEVDVTLENQLRHEF